MVPFPSLDGCPLIRDRPVIYSMWLKSSTIIFCWWQCVFWNHGHAWTGGPRLGWFSFFLKPASKLHGCPFSLLLTGRSSALNGGGLTAIFHTSREWGMTWPPFLRLRSAMERPPSVLSRRGGVFSFRYPIPVLLNQWPLKKWTNVWKNIISVY